MDTVKHMKDHNMAAAARDARKKSEDGFWDTIKVIIQALLIAFAVRSSIHFSSSFRSMTGNVRPSSLMNPS